MYRRLAPVACLLALTAVAVAEPDRDDDEPTVSPAEPFAPSPRMDFSADLIDGALLAPAAEMTMGATPGGAQDVAFARARIEAGEVPHPSTFTPEGLFSEHDLPAPAGRVCDQLLCVVGATAPADLVGQPEVRAIAQLAFGTNIDAATWRRAPLNLVAVVDKSGSMSGAPLNTVKASLHRIADQLVPGDQLAIVLYGDRTHLHLAPTAVSDRRALHAQIEAIESAGSTNMEAGLALGFEVARKSGARFEGTSRVMLFTDERPNVGRTDAGSFMAMARAASQGGVGLTTVGVGTHFGAELATRISSVRGGNLVFFPDVPTMVERLAAELDTLVSELAYGLELEVEPAPGHQIVGLYGVPGDAVERTARGGLRIGIETVFLSRKQGAIFLGFAPEPGAVPAPGPLGTARLRYEIRGGKRYEDATWFTPMEGPLPIGLARGRALVDEVTALKLAAMKHTVENDQEGAWQVARALRMRLAQAAVPGLESELKTVAALEETLRRLSGHGGEVVGARDRDPISGLPR
ncbi:MAG: VWA domain-containing protein [Myxococcales bacterium]|nr:VWA domain-containing protein [Myxococcales bacterium]